MTEQINISKAKNKRKIKNPTIICGYNGDGFVGALAINHIVEQMKFEEVGSSQLREVPPILAVKDNRMMKPLSLLYDKKNNLLAIFILAPTLGIEWDIADVIEKVYNDTQAKQIVVADGISVGRSDHIFYISNRKHKKLSYAQNLTNSMIGGLTAALLMKDLKVIAFLGKFDPSDPQKIVPAHTAANVVNGLNNYLGIKVDTKKLEQLGDKMQQELRQFVGKLKETQMQNYIG